MGKYVGKIPLKKETTRKHRKSTKSKADVVTVSVIM